MKCLIGEIGKGDRNMEIRQIALEIAQLVEKKNHDYDNSFDKNSSKKVDSGERSALAEGKRATAGEFDSVGGYSQFRKDNFGTLQSVQKKQAV